MDLTKYPLWLLRSRLNEDKKYVGVVVPLSLYEGMERLAYKEKLTVSDIIRMALWDFLRENKGGEGEDFKQN